ncbi:hypothetical protein [Streptomyces sp. NPDC059272]|uniref:hypothetical protein n=1 Tax=Streptomyces sp. NPDC059272 TaxID=3346800 RepID=UPI0036B99EC8
MSEGFVLNGRQHDVCWGADTVPLTKALRIATPIARTGNRPSEATWVRTADGIAARTEPPGP